MIDPMQCIDNVLAYFVMVVSYKCKMGIKLKTELLITVVKIFTGQAQRIFLGDKILILNWIYPETPGLVGFWAPRLSAERHSAQCE
jgi:hypothetical protein